MRRPGQLQSPSRNVATSLWKVRLSGLARMAGSATTRWAIRQSHGPKASRLGLDVELRARCHLRVSTAVDRDVPNAARVERLAIPPKDGGEEA